MTPVRPFPEDIPKRQTTWRRGRIRTRQAAVADGYSYIVDYEPVGTEMAFSHQRYNPNDIVHARWRNEAATWWIDGFEQPIAILYNPIYAPVSGSPMGATRWWPGLQDESADPPVIGEFLSIARQFGMTVSPDNQHVLLSRGFYNATPTPLFSVVPVSLSGYGSPIVHAPDSDQFLTMGMRARWSPNGLWILTSNAAETLSGPDPGNIPAAIAFPWDPGTATLGAPVDAPLTVPAFRFGSGVSGIDWNPDGNSVLIGEAYAVEWTGAGFGSVIGQPPTPSPTEHEGAFAKFSRSGRAAVYRGTFSSGRFLWGSAFTGSAWGAPHAAYTALPNGFPYDAVWSLDNSQVAFLSRGATAHIYVFGWDDDLGILPVGGALGSELFHYTFPEDTQGSFTTQLDLSPDGRYLLFIRTRNTELTGTLHVMEWKPDGTLGVTDQIDSWTRAVAGSAPTGQPRLGAAWYPPGYA